MLPSSLFGNLVARPVSAYQGDPPPLTRVTGVQSRKRLCFAVCVNRSPGYPELDETLLWGIGRKGHADIVASLDGNHWDYSEHGSKDVPFAFDFGEAVKHHTRPIESNLDDILELLRYGEDQTDDHQFYIVTEELRRKRKQSPTQSRSSSVMSRSPTPERMQRLFSPSASASEESVPKISLTLREAEVNQYGNLPFTLRVKKSTELRKLVEKVRSRVGRRPRFDVRFTTERVSHHYLDNDKTLGEAGVENHTSLWYHYIFEPAPVPPMSRETSRSASRRRLRVKVALRKRRAERQPE